MIFSEDLIKLSLEAETALAEKFKELDEISFKNTVKVMDSFRKHTVNETYFAPTSGYGYGDRGRDTLDLIYADVFGAESAFVRHNIVNGTQAPAIPITSSRVSYGFPATDKRVSPGLKSP